MKRKVYCFSKSEIIDIFDKNQINSIDSIKKDIAIISLNNRKDTLEDWTTEYLFIKSEDDIVSNNNILSLRVNDDEEDFSPQMARIIIYFIRKYKDCDIIVHCIMGKSRSQAVCRFILDTWPDKYDYAREQENPLKTPNYHILSTLKRIWRLEFEE